MLLHLDQTFKPLLGDQIDFSFFTFSGGEPHIRIESFAPIENVTITHRIRSFNDLGKLCIAVDALRRMGVKNIEVLLPYFPAARQDRVMVPGESLTVKVYAEIINQLKLSRITIVDPHSDVTPALLNNCTVLNNYSFIKKVIEELPEEFVLISPDAGASKKIISLAKAIGASQVVECSKKRDLVTGKLSGFDVHDDDLSGKPCLIVDDICDGGGTFLGLANELKKSNSGKLYLAVTHGIFSKGLNGLDQYFEKIFTTDSFQNMEANHCIEQVLLEDLLK